MTKYRWNYSGNVNLEYGGLFWCEDGSDDYVLAVRVTPCSDAGGPDNLFHIERGSIYLPLDAKKRAYALSTIGVMPDEATRRDVVEAFLIYHGIDRGSWDGEQVIQIGKAQDPRGWNPKPDFVLRGNSKLRRFVKRELLD